MGTSNQRFWPFTANWDGTDPSGGDVWKFDTADPGPGPETTVCDFGSSGAKTITCDPGTTRATTGLTDIFGWAINIAGADGMDGTAAAKRWIKAGTWLFQGTVMTTLAASLNACTVGVNVYRVAASPSTTRTLLFSDSVSAGLIALTPGTSWSLTTASQSEIVLEAGETIQVTFTLACTGQIGGLSIVFRLGATALRNTTLFDVPSPGIRTLGEGTGAATGVGTGDGVGGKVLNTIGTATGSGVAAGVLGATGGMVGTAVGSGVAAGLMSSLAGTTGTAVGSGTATGVLGATGAMVGTATGVGDAVGVLGAIGGMTGTAAGSGTATGVLGATGGMTGTAVGSGVAAGLGSSVAGTIGTAAGVGTAAGLASIVLGTVGTVEIGVGGSTTIVKKPLFPVYD